MRIAAISPVYVVCYTAAGILIAWANPTVREFYSNGADFNVGAIFGLQFVRGVLWGLIAWVMVRGLKNSTVSRALVVGAAFCVFGAVQLLYPSGFMPWPVRSAHLIEIAISNFVFGYLSGLILLAGGGSSAKS